MFAGKDKYGSFLDISGFRAAMPDEKTAQLLAKAYDLGDTLRDALPFLRAAALTPGDNDDATAVLVRARMELAAAGLDEAIPPKGR
jgi:hypothetical protein